MIKGVNKRIVEVSLPQSEFFEKALVFIRAEADDVKTFSGADAMLEEAARNALSEADICGISRDGEVSGHKNMLTLLVNFGAWAAAFFRLLWHGAVIVCAVWVIRAMIWGG